MMLAKIFLNYFCLTLFIIIKDCNAIESKVQIDGSVKDSKIINADLKQSDHGEISKLPAVIPKYDSPNIDDLNTPLNGAQDNIDLEGGDATPVKPNNAAGTATISDDSNHSTGSKGRKGVGLPASSIVPRKGVNQLEATESNNSLKSPKYTKPEKLFLESSNTTISLNKTVLTTNVSHEALQKKPFDTLKKVHVKKPEIVSDKDVLDDFDKYSIIKTSTTGEDYVIIGIVIVIGIWFSVFGALIFYRRAGEYWDRRHYRRMDFLVEGMYND